ncbi:hypothetical protein VNO77_02980 [Canavalia gladiata]|uniref:Uncharacterized protein n=1 Tax=Canavalia gladiata TaxID=3824 RepID=A0AAN9MU22_CANGL
MFGLTFNDLYARLGTNHFTKIKKRFRRTAERERQKEERKNKIEKVARIPHSTVVTVGKTKEYEAQNIELVQRCDQIPSNRNSILGLCNGIVLDHERRVPASSYVSI